MPNESNTSNLNQQYSTASNLNIRIALHQLFSTNKTGWSNWVFEKYTIQPNMTVLELGCGNGNLWKQHAFEIPDNVQLVLSDISEGMVETARKNTEDLDFVKCKQIDAQNIPYVDHAFDVVIANHMLYHVPDIRKALSEISRVLKPTGVFYATTIGENNFKELIEMLDRFDPRIDFAQNSIIKAFGLETGEKWLSEFFGSVLMDRYEDSLHITSTQPLVDYVLSSAGIGNANEIIRGDKIDEFKRYVERVFEEKGYIDIQKDAGIFICKNRIKELIQK